MIKLTLVDGSPIWVNPETIAEIWMKGSVTMISLTTHEDGVYGIRESPEDVVSAINAHVPAWAQRMTDILDRLEKGTILT